MEAARENGTRVVVIRRPEEDGISLEEAMEVLKKADEGKVGELKTHLILAGIGMGQPSQMTGEVLRAIRESDALIGAGRMLESAERALQNDLLISKEGKTENRQESAAAVEKERKCYKAYLPDDVIQIVSKHPEWKQAVILYSGDTGFFSGASRWQSGCGKLVIHLPSIRVHPVSVIWRHGWDALKMRRFIPHMEENCLSIG